jgi:DNA mismatch repair ATPase MutS
MDTRSLAAGQAPASAAAGRPEESDTLGPSGGSVTWAAALHVTSGGGITALACFDSDTNELWATQGSDDASFAFLKLAVLTASPRLLFIPSSSSDEFLAAVKEGMAECGGSSRREVSLVTSSLFALDACRGRLSSVRIDDLPVGHTLNHLHTCIRLDADCQVRAAGALIACLQKDGLLPTSLSSLREASLSNFLTLDDAARQALAIFTVDPHPDVLKQGRAASKEGLCVASLLDTCLTPGGSRMLRSWLKRPLVDVDALNQRLGAVASLLGGDATTGSTLALALAHVRDVSRGLDRLRVVAAFTTLSEWKGLCLSLIHI